MYALTCPACHDVRHVPFVRAGAVTRCPACQHQWSIKDRQVVREDRRTTARPVAPVVVPGTPGPASLDALEDDPKGGSSVTGLSGLSDLMQDVPQPDPKPVPESAPAKPRAAANRTATPPSAAVAKPTAAPAAAGAAGLSSRVRAGLAVGGAAGVILLLWIALGRGEGPAPDDQPEATHATHAASAQGGPKAHRDTPAEDSALDLTHPVGPPMPDEAPVPTP